MPRGLVLVVRGSKISPIRGDYWGRFMDDALAHYCISGAWENDNDD